MTLLLQFKNKELISNKNIEVLRFHCNHRGKKNTIIYLFKLKIHC